MVGIRPLSLVFLMLALLLPASASAEPTTRIIVKHDSGLTAAEQRDIRADAGVRRVDTLRLPRTEVVVAPAGEASQAVRELNQDPDVVYAEVDHKVHAFDDPLFGWQWALKNTGQQTPDYGQNQFVTGTVDADMDVPEAWAKGMGNGQMVAVVDSGVQLDHPDLAPNLAPGYDWVDRDNTPNDANGHGTHVAGIISAHDDEIGTVGVAPGAFILPLRVLGADGSGNTSDVAEAFDFAGDQGVRIVNASLGSSQSSIAEHDAIEAHPDTLYVVAAGNDHADVDTHPEYPCAYQDLDNIICVGASDDNDQPAPFSNYGANTVDIFAPGDRIVSTYLMGGYAVGGGTSQAAPHVAGEAALILSRNPGVDRPTLQARILSTGDEKPGVLDTISVSGARANASTALDQTVADKDNDHVNDAIDNCPSMPNNDQTNVCPTQTAVDNADSDNDGVKDPQDRCTYQAGSPSTAGCPGVAPDTDGDTKADMFDNCPAVSNSSQADTDDDGIGDACDSDIDNDGVANGPDNCDANYNPNQADGDRDGIGDACDGDRDGDGRANSADSCPDVAGATSNGCPVIATAPIDSDGDGISNPSDSCPYERAATADGCPLPSVTSLSAHAKKRHGKRTAATISVRSSRAAMVEVTIQIRKCTHGHCRWARVTRKTTATVGGRATITATRLKKGRYRAVVVLSSNAGSAAAETQSFRVR
jgi:thermitase